MQHAQTKRIWCAASWVLCAACMAVIFYFSSRTATESTAQSGQVRSLLESLLGQTLTSFIVRKAAHFAEYAALSFLFANALYQSGARRWGIWAAACTSLYAVTDEVHQIFVEGRSCQFSDWLLDTVGGIAGAAVFFALLCLLQQLLKKRKQRFSHAKKT